MWGGTLDFSKLADKISTFDVSSLSLDNLSLDNLSLDNLQGKAVDSDLTSDGAEEEVKNSATTAPFIPTHTSDARPQGIRGEKPTMDMSKASSSSSSSVATVEIAREVSAGVENDQQLILDEMGRIRNMLRSSDGECTSLRAELIEAKDCIQSYEIKEQLAKEENAGLAVTWNESKLKFEKEIADLQNLLQLEQNSSADIKESLEQNIVTEKETSSRIDTVLERAKELLIEGKSDLAKLAFELKEAKKAHEKSNRNHEKDISDTKDEAKALAKDLQAVTRKSEEDLKTAKRSAVALQEQIDTLRKGAKERNQEIAKLKKDLAILQRGKSSTNSTASTASPPEVAEVNNSFEVLLREASEEKAVLDEALEKCKFSLESREQEFIIVQSENASLQGELESLQVALRCTEEQKTASESKCKSAEVQLESMHSTLQENEEKIVRLELAKESVDNQVADLTKALSKAKDEQKSAQDSAKKSTRKDVEMAKKNLQASEEQRRNLEMAAEKLTSELAELSKSSSGALSEQRLGLEKIAESLRAELAALTKSSKDELCKLTLSSEELSKLSQSKDAEITRIVSSLSTLQDVSDKQAAEIAALSREIAEKNISIDELNKSVLSINVSFEEEKKILSGTSETRLQDALFQMEVKDKKIEDLDNKLKSLTEKMKDVVKRYAESKAKVHSLEQAEDSKVQSKDSEVLSMRLKLEAMERSLSDQRDVSSELKDKLGEMKRELERAKATIDEDTLTCEVLKEELAEAHQLSRSRSEEVVVAQAVSDKLLLQLSEAENAQKDELSMLTSSMTKQVEELRENAAALQTENESLRNRIASESVSASSLEEYKKRAQLAMKKANAASSTMKAEVQKAHKDLSDAQLRAADAEAALEAEREGIVKAGQDSDDLRFKLSEAREEIGQLQRELIDANNSKCEISAALASAEERANQFAQSVVQRGGERSRHFAVFAESEHGSPSAIPQSTPNYSVSRELKLERASKSLQTPGPSRATGDDPPMNALLQGSCSIEKDLAMEITSTPPVVSSIIQNSPKVTCEPVSRAKQSPAMHKSDKKNHISTWEESADPTMRTLTVIAPGTGGGEDYDVDDLDAMSSMKVKAPASAELFYVNELYVQIEDLRREVSQRGLEVDAVHSELQLERDAKTKASQRVEELLAFLDRSKKLQDGPDSVINMEYLKNCVYRFMATVEHSEKKRLFPVIATILKLTSKEQRTIELALDSYESPEKVMNSFGALASTTFGSFFAVTSSTPSSGPNDPST